MKNRNDEIRQANRKAIPKFILALILACLAGGALGFCISFFGLETLAGTFHAAGAAFSRQIAPWLLVVCAVLEAGVCLPLYFTSKREVRAWDGEDEIASDRIDRRLSVTLWISSVAFVCAMFLLTASYAGGDHPALVFMGIAAFLVVMAETILVQQRMVDLTKRLYPEKQGSVYEFRFKKKWMDSCDEAEKILIGQCAYRAYNAVNRTCMLLWLIFTLTALFLDTGFLPVLTVCIIWAVSQSVYCYWSIKLSTPPACGRGTPR